MEEIKYTDVQLNNAGKKEGHAVTNNLNTYDLHEINDANAAMYERVDTKWTRTRLDQGDDPMPSRRDNIAGQLSGETENNGPVVMKYRHVVDIICV